MKALRHYTSMSRAAKMKFANNMSWRVMTLAELRRLRVCSTEVTFCPAYVLSFCFWQCGIQIENFPQLCPPPSTTVQCAVHIAAPSGYILHSCTVDNFCAITLTKVVILDEVGDRYQVLYCSDGPRGRLLSLPKTNVCVKYPIVVSYSDDTQLLSFQYRMVSLTYTYGLELEFDVEYKY
jgi:hypothetical protein